jgi:DNA-formamidopyrimidine glycosylase
MGVNKKPSLLYSREMPEVIEVRMFRDFIDRHFVGKTCEDIKILAGRYKDHGPWEDYKKFKSKLPARVVSVNNKGKFLWITFDNGFHLVNTTGLYGGWVYISASNRIYFPTLWDYRATEQTDGYRAAALKHKNISFLCGDGAVLYYYDQLSFGTMKLYNDDELAKRLDKIGPDIMENDSNPILFAEELSKPKHQEKAIGVALLDQQIVSGIGNYLRADTLWMSRISPFRKVKDLTKAEIKKIWISARSLSWSKYNYKEGLRRKVYLESQKFPFHYDRDFFVYMEDKDVEGNPVRKEELSEGSQKRTIHYVPERQH